MIEIMATNIFTLIWLFHTVWLIDTAYRIERGENTVDKVIDVVSDSYPFYMLSVSVYILFGIGTGNIFIRYSSFTFFILSSLIVIGMAIWEYRTCVKDRFVNRIRGLYDDH